MAFNTLFKVEYSQSSATLRRQRKHSHRWQSLTPASGRVERRSSTYIEKNDDNRQADSQFLLSPPITSLSATRLATAILAQVLLKSTTTLRDRYFAYLFYRLFFYYLKNSKLML